MAKFIGSDLKSDNWGEDRLVQKLIEYFDDSYVIYRNRPIFGAQFDVCLIAPNIGIIIFEVKAWSPDTILRIENGDSIIIKSSDNYTGLLSEAKENPTTQVRGYVYKMRSRIRQKTGKMPLIYGMVCFPNISKDAYEKKGIAPICEYEETILKDDLDTRGAFLKKMNLCIKNHKNAAKYNSPFNSELLFRVRQIFETDLKIEDLSIENTDIIFDFTFENAPTTVELSKADVTTCKEIPGARLEVTDKDGNVVDKWTSTEEPHIIKKLVVGKTYYLTERIPANGYATAETIEFTIENTADIQKVQMFDEPIKVLISKTDITTCEEIPGAKLTIFDKDGKVVRTWTSGKEPTYIEKLPIGDYVLR